jgi:hypothetical protein
MIRFPRALRRTVCAFALVPALAMMATSTPAGAWGSTGHRWIGRLGVASLPSDVPDFLKQPGVIASMGELSREPDRSRGAGQPHDEDFDPGHFLSIEDDGTVAGASLTSMPPSRDAFSVVVHAHGQDLHKSGWLYYNLVDGYEQLAKDFAYWRVDVVGEKRGATPQEKQWYAADRQLRELIIIRDIGYWSHFVGDASQPMHASVHYNGWGHYPNPHDYTQDKIHGPFEGAFIHDYVSEAAVRAAMPAPAPCKSAIGDCMAQYLLATQAQVAPVYALWTAGGFHPGDKRGVDFATARVAAGAAELRDLIVRAWHDSRDQTVGYPGIKVSDIEGGGAPLAFGAMYGDD